MGILTRLRFFTLRAQGFTGPMARHWVGITQADKALSDSGLTHQQLREAHRWGFSAATVIRFGITAENRHEFVSEREYAHCAPLNGKYGKWVRDKVATQRIFAPFQENFHTLHYHFVHRNGEFRVLPLSPAARSLGSSLDAVRELLQNEGNLELSTSLWRDREALHLKMSGDEIDLGGTHLTWEQLTTFLMERTRDQSIVLSAPARTPESHAASPVRLRVIMSNDGGLSPEITEAFIHLGEAAEEESINPSSNLSSDYMARVDPDTGEYSGARRLQNLHLEEVTHDSVSGQPLTGNIPRWRQLVDTLVRMGKFAPQLEFVQYDILQSTQSTRIIGLAAHPDYPQHFPFSPATVTFLRTRTGAKRKTFDSPLVRIRRGLRNGRLRLRRDFARLAYPKGLRPYQSTRWPADVLRDLFQRNGVPLRTKFWAYRHGFLSYRIGQYGITTENRSQFISDFEYRWLRHINGKYRYWLEDKISIKYVATRFGDHLPRYYYHTTRIGGVTHLVPLMDCPPEYGHDLAEILRLAKATGVLALKPDEGSHGAGFYRLQASENGGFLLNGRPATAQEVLDVLSSPDAEYLVTEFIEQHASLAEIYPDSVNTVRIIVYKPDGANAQIGATYLRIGSRHSGFVDNVASGGLVTEVDRNTGRFAGAFALSSGRLTPFSRHPDTGTPIVGAIPHWQHVLAVVKQIAEDIEHLEYFGFDVAVTPNGIMIPEINRFPDYPRIAPMPSELIDYLLRQLVMKKAKYGYDIQRPRTLISLPRRPH